jgi:hypothetical protein
MNKTPPIGISYWEYEYKDSPIYFTIEYEIDNTHFIYCAPNRKGFPGDNKPSWQYISTWHDKYKIWSPEDNLRKQLTKEEYELKSFIEEL